MDVMTINKVGSIGHSPSLYPGFLDPLTSLISKAEKTGGKIFYGSKVLSVLCLRNNRLKNFNLIPQFCGFK